MLATQSHAGLISFECISQNSMVYVVLDSSHANTGMTVDTLSAKNVLIGPGDCTIDNPAPFPPPPPPPGSHSTTYSRVAVVLPQSLTGTVHWQLGESHAIVYVPPSRHCTEIEEQVLDQLNAASQSIDYEAVSGCPPHGTQQNNIATDAVDVTAPPLTNDGTTLLDNSAVTILKTDKGNYSVCVSTCLCYAYIIIVSKYIVCLSYQFISYMRVHTVCRGRRRRRGGDWVGSNYHHHHHHHRHY
jgi:hypothetical protein